MDDKLLLPCPFCGGQVKLMAIAGEPYPPTYEVDIANITVESDDICYVHCPTCDANWHIELRIDAFPLKTIAAWNRRVQPELTRCEKCDYWDKSASYMSAHACAFWSSGKKTRYTENHEFCSFAERKEE